MTPELQRVVRLTCREQLCGDVACWPNEDVEVVAGAVVLQAHTGCSH